MNRHSRIIFHLWLTIAGLCFLCFALLLLDDPTMLYFWNASILFAICLCILISVYKLVQNEPEIVWTPILWYTFTFGVYFGFGSMVILFGPHQTIEYINETYPTDQNTLLKITALNLTGFLITLSSFLAVSFVLPQNNPTPINEETNLRQAQFFAILFLVIGVSVRYVFVFPYVFGLTNFILPSAISQLEVLLLISIVLISYLRVKTRGWLWSSLFAILLPLEAAASLLTYSKLAFLTMPIAAVLGSFLAHKNIFKLSVSGIFIIVAYTYISPLISGSRIEFENHTQEAAASPFTTRWKVLQIVATKQDEQSEFEESEDKVPMGWWSRLCYTNVQSFALYEISVGSEFYTYEKWPYFFIPRLLMPDKPQMTDDGADFTERIHGTRTSSTGLGLYMEGYWNGGIFGFVIFSTYMGLVLAFLSRQSLFFVLQRKWLYLPLSFMSVRLGINGPVEWFFSGFVGSMVLYFGFYCIFWFFDKLKIIPQ